MADHTPTGPLETGRPHGLFASTKRPIRVFLSLAKYGSLFCVALLAAMAFGFFTNAGFFSATCCLLVIWAAAAICCATSRHTLPEHISSSGRGSFAPVEVPAEEGLGGGTDNFHSKGNRRERAARRGFAGYGKAAGRHLASKLSSRRAPAAVAHSPTTIRQGRRTIGNAADAAKPTSCSRCAGRPMPSSRATSPARR